ncbi:MAG: AAA family ATPase [Actinomycetota bacterium]|nr:AAA family ATPase [Actinomycetota bacterium]
MTSSAPKRARGKGANRIEGGYLRSITLLRDQVPSFDSYPFSIPAVRGLNTLPLHPQVTFFIGENGTGKSTLLEAIAIKAGFNAEGGSKNFNFATRNSESDLSQTVRLTRGPVREQDGWFLRAESLYNVATEIDRLGVQGYGPTSMHEQSHGESFMALANHRFRGRGLYFLDEPEAALSPSRQLAFLKIIAEHVTNRASQFIIATHSPIILAYPLATIYLFTGEGIAPTTYEETEHFKVTSDFLVHREAYLHHLLLE